MNQILNKKTNQHGFAHMFLLAMIIVIGVASFGAYRVVTSSASIKTNTVSVNSANGCWLAGRKWDANGARKGECLTQCRNQDTQFNKNGNASGYCRGHISHTGDPRVCTVDLHRIYIDEVNGCARKSSESDAKDQRYCQAGYPNYTTRNEGKTNAFDICEKDKSPTATGSNTTSGQSSTPQNDLNSTPAGSTGSQTGSTTAGSTGTATPGTSSTAEEKQPEETEKKTTIRIGAYNAWSVTKKNSRDQVRRIQIGMDKMRDNGAEIIALQELSSSQTFALKKNSYWWGVYRSDMDGNRGLGVAYRKDDFKVISTSDLVIPRLGADPHEPVVTLERKKDKARITVMSVHLVAYFHGKRNYDKYQPLQQKAIKDKAENLKKQGHTVILAGDFNWDFKKNEGYMKPFEYKGYEIMNFLVPPDQKLSNFKHIEVKQASDHDLVFVDAETTTKN